MVSFGEIFECLVRIFLIGKFGLAGWVLWISTLVGYLMPNPIYTYIYIF